MECRVVLGDRGVAEAPAAVACKGFPAEKDIERSDVGVESSMAVGV
jgi:hypothetical protein